MKPTRRTTLALVGAVCLSLSAPSVFAQEPDLVLIIEPSPLAFDITITAPLNLRVGNAFPMSDTEQMAELITQQAVPLAVRQLDDEDDEEAKSLVPTLEPESRWIVHSLTVHNQPGGSPPKLQVTIDLSPGAIETGNPDIAPETLRNLQRRTAARLSSILKDAFRERFSPEIEAAHMANQLAESDLDRYRNESNALLREFQQVMRQAGVGFASISREGVLEAIGRREEQRQAVNLELATLDVRRNAIERRIAETTTRIEAALQQDPISDQLLQIVEMRQQQLELAGRLMESGRMSSTEKMDLEAEVLQARNRRMLRQEEVRNTNGGDRIAQLNNDLGEISVHLTELAIHEARLNRPEADNALDKALQLADEYEMVMTRLDVAKDIYREALHLKADVYRRINSAMISPQAPQVTVSWGRP